MRCSAQINANTSYSGIRVKPTRRDLLQAKVEKAAVAEKVLEPVVSFLARAGVGKAELDSAVSKIWAKHELPRTSVTLTTLRDPQPFVELVTAWTRDSNYLDSAGEPRDLSIRGRYGFNSLVRASSPSTSPKMALSVLQSYGNVIRLKTKRVRLAKPFFHIRGDNRLAFEPSVRFLLDAAGNVRESAGRKMALRDPAGEHFWRSVDSRVLPKRYMSAYLKFVKEHSLAFLQDVDDWLVEKATSPSKRSVKQGRRVGVGLFTFESSDNE